MIAPNGIFQNRVVVAFSIVYKLYFMIVYPDFEDQMMSDRDAKRPFVMDAALSTLGSGRPFSALRHHRLKTEERQSRSASNGLGD